MKNIFSKQITIIILFLLAGTFCSMGQDEDFNKLVTKIFDNDVAGLRELIKSGIDVNTRNSSGATPLILASSFRDKDEIIKCLVESGADVNAVGLQDGKSALVWAAGRSPEATRYLLSKGADPNIVGNDGTTPLISAAFGVFKGGTYESLDLLIKAGADINKTSYGGDSHGYTAISYAARNGYPDLVEYLIKNGADVNHKTSLGDTPLIIAAGEGYAEIAKQLLDAGADKSLTNKAGKTALDIAVEKNNTGIADLLK